MPLTAGDIIIVPHGDSHTVWNGAGCSNGAAGPFDPVAAINRFRSGDLRTTRFGGAGPVTRFVCGYFGCERHAGRLFLAGLPALIKVNMRGTAAGQWLETSIRFLVADASSGRPGGAALLAKLTEALFVETLRRYMEQSPPERACWLAGARDPVVGAALALLHRKPWHSWTLAELAAEVGASRSVVAERFARFLGEPPLRYLARWRLQLAARLLQTTRKAIMELACDVGYASEAAFNRAFKREFGLPPAQYRRKLTDRTTLDNRRR